ncbi:zinc ribbon domain-containing protein [Olsenella sp. AM39-30AC]|uniref:zinc ribbon domain-containing protein n=1 Tax=Olsenella sp. AM39-30AC TaxID=2292360 RepID=UPI000E501282|nr:zinc ribbon domain-containing protein [Olsenella sp. AM39-30AC]RHB54787.1 zinc ribbon domain-containing protein [Olsenella sp. AM39-30AC]
MFCPQCGKKLAGTEKFCPNCGFDLSWPSRSAAASATAAPAGQQAQPQAQPQQVSLASAPAHSPKAVTASELVTLAAALLMGIAAFLPFLIVSGSSYDYSVALTDAPDGAVLVLLAIATAVLPMVRRRTAALVLSSITTAFSLFEICSVGIMLLNSTSTAYYVNLGAGFCLLIVGIAMGVLSIILLARDNMHEKLERQRVMGSFIPANGTTPRQL